MSTAELHSLMSQLQVQHENPHASTNFATAYFDRKFTYFDGTPGDDLKEAVPGERPPTQLKISTWHKGVYLNKKKTVEFAEFTTAQAGPNGSIDYTDVEAQPGHMTRTIAWEAFHRRKAEIECRDLHKQIKQLTSCNTPQAKNSNRGSFTFTEGPGWQYTGSTSACAAPGTRRKKRSPRSPQQQQQRFEKKENNRVKKAEEKGAVYNPRVYKPRGGK
jgi:hypothetical protein